MANERIPNDPYRAGDPNPADAPYRYKPRSDYGDDELRTAARVDDDLQVDPELAEGPASGGRIAMYAVAIAVVLGAVFYGLNNSSINEASTAPPATTAQNAPAKQPAAPPGMRDVTPRANSQPGTTTGAAPSATPNAAPSMPSPKSADPKAPPAPAPSGGTE
jgi:hypothetical protein